MERYYNPITQTEAIPGIHDLSGTTKQSGMPKSSREWFERSANEGYKWDCLNGKWPEEVPLPPPTEEQLYLQWKAERQQAIDNIKVEIDGLLFDGDEVSQSRMARAFALADSPDETIRWILADNTVTQVTADQLRRAAREAGRVQEALWIPPEAE